MSLHVGSADVRRRASRFFRLLTARLRPTADAEVSRGAVRLVVGQDVLSAPLSLTESPSEAAEQAVTALLALLDPSAGKIGGLRLVVSDFWLRPLVFPLGEATLSDQELEAVVLHQYQQVFGKLMTGWSCRWDRQPNGLLLAMAWPDALLNLRSLLAERRIRLRSALPQSLSAIRKVTMAPGAACFVFVGAHGLTFIRLEQNGWRQWRTVGSVGATAEAVSSQVFRLAAQQDDDCRNVWFQAPDMASGQRAEIRRIFADAGWTAHLVEAAK